MGNLGRTGITRGGIDFLDLGASGQLPDQGMFPGPAANNQYLQYFPLPLYVIWYSINTSISPRGALDLTSII